MSVCVCCACRVSAMLKQGMFEVKAGCLPLRCAACLLWERPSTLISAVKINREREREIEDRNRNNMQKSEKCMTFLSDKMAKDI